MLCIYIKILTGCTDIEVPVDDLLNPTTHSKSGLTASGSSKRAQSGLLLRPISHHPHTSKIDADSEAGSSVHISLLSRGHPLRGQVSSPSMADRGLKSSASSVKSLARSTASHATTSTVSATPRRASKVGNDTSLGMSPARRLASEVRAKDRTRDRPDSKLTPSIVEPERDSYVIEGEDEYDYNERLHGYREDYDRRGLSDEDDLEGDEGDNASLSSSEMNQKLEDKKETPKSPSTHSPAATRTVKKILITQESLACLKSAGSLHDGRLKPSSASIKSQSTLRSTLRSPTSSTNTMSTFSHPRSNSRGSTRSSRLNVSVTGSGPRARPATRPVSGSSISVTATTKTGTFSSRPISSASTSTINTTETVTTFRTAGTGPSLSTPTANRSRKTSTTSSVLGPSQRTSSSSSPVQERTRKISSASISSVASTTGSFGDMRSTTNAGTRIKKSTIDSSVADPGKLNPSSAVTISSKPRPIQASTSKGSVASTDSVSSARKKPVPVGTLGRKPVTKTKSIESMPPIPLPGQTVPDRDITEHTSQTVEEANNISSKENVTLPVARSPEQPATLSNPPDTMTIRPKDGGGEHRKTNSSASISSVSTLRRKGSSDTIKNSKVSTVESEVTRPVSKALPPPPTEATSSPLSSSIQSPPVQPYSIEQVLSEYVPRGATLDVGIPCIISSKRKRFKAYARYIGEVEGEKGPWVGVEVPMLFGDNWGDTDNTNKSTDDRQWHDGSWGGIRYFEIGGMGSEMDYGDDRASRRRRLDGSVSSLADGKGLLKREADQLSITSDRRKRMRSVSPAVSDTSCTESRGLFVRPSQVLYVVDAVGTDF